MPSVVVGQWCASFEPAEPTMSVLSDNVIYAMAMDGSGEGYLHKVGM